MKMRINILTLILLVGFAVPSIDAGHDDIKETTYRCHCKHKTSKSQDVKIRWGTDPYQDPLPKAEKQCQEVCSRQRDELLKIEPLKTR
jgi:hypothetical protein